MEGNHCEEEIVNSWEMEGGEVPGVLLEMTVEGGHWPQWRRQGRWRRSDRGGRVGEGGKGWGEMGTSPDIDTDEEKLAPNYHMDGS